jgi:hypothetical protein
MTLEIPDTHAVDEGIYPAVLTKIDLKSTEAGEFRIWAFDVTADGKVEKVTAASSLMLGPKSKAYKWVSALLGRRPAPGEKLELVGLPCQLHLIVDEDTGYNKVESVLPANGRPVASSAPLPAPTRPTIEADDPSLPNLPDEFPLEEPPENYKELIP